MDSAEQYEDKHSKAINSLLTLNLIALAPFFFLLRVCREAEFLP